MKKNEMNLLPEKVIMNAVNEDEEALREVVKHFKPYILELSKERYVNEVGNVHYYVNDEIKSLLEIKLMTAILKFEID